MLKENRASTAKSTASRSRCSDAGNDQHLVKGDANERRHPSQTVRCEIALPLAVLMMAIFASSGAFAQEAAAQGDAWQVGLSIYSWFTDISGETVFAEPGGDFEIGVENILDNLEFTFMGILDVRKGRWGLLNDLIYMDVEGTQIGIKPHQGSALIPKIAMFTLALCLCMASTQPAAAKFDGSDALLCAVTPVSECEADRECDPVTIEVAAIPRFLKINFEEKIISTTEESNRTDVSAIGNFERVDGRLILQGAENGRAWSIVIFEENGKMSATISDEEVGFVVFGACTKN